MRSEQYAPGAARCIAQNMAVGVLMLKNQGLVLFVALTG